MFQILFLVFMMFSILRVFSVICVFLSFRVECSVQKTYNGRQNPSCVQNYHRNFVNRTAPSRNYQYYHETLIDNESKNNMKDVQFRISGGEPASIEETPYQVLYGYNCGGILLAPEWVMTAAHCKPQDYVHAGSTHRSQTTEYPICAHFPHPLWSALPKLHTFDYDYELLLLATPIPVTSRSRPIAIGNVQDIQEGAMVTVSGWGITNTEQQAMEENLRRVQVPIISLSTCRSLPLEIYKTVTDRMFCAGVPAKDSCKGDSGGPAVVNGKLVGLVSFGVNCAIEGQPGVYSNIPKVIDWIRTVTELPL